MSAEARSIPIILHHGFMDVFNVRIGRRGIYSFKGIDDTLSAGGRSTRRTRVHPTASIERRAAQLREQVLETLKTFPRGSRALIVAHSMGGLDARYMITHLDMAEKVAALLTISTPHRGTAYADYALQNMKRWRVNLLFNLLGLDWGAVEDLTPLGCEAFNDRTPDHGSVRYFSICAACEPGDLPPWSRRAHGMISKAEGPNDGLVSVRSAMYGEHLGTWNTNHWKLLNKSGGSHSGTNVVREYERAIQRVLEQI